MHRSPSIAERPPHDRPAISSGARMRLIVVSDTDPVAQGVGEALGRGRPTSWHVDGATVHELRDGTLLVRRPGMHVRDETLQASLPLDLSVQLETVIFPSVHRAESGRPALTVHPLGNLMDSAEVGGRPYELNPVPARLMTSAFLRLVEEGRRLGQEVTFEATHHGPLLNLPSFFIEVGTDPSAWKNPEAHAALARVLSGLTTEATDRDRVVLGVGGGHYAPRFTEMVQRNRVSVGHIVPRHAWESLPPIVMEALVARTPQVEGVIYARAADVRPSRLGALLPQILEKDLERRAPRTPN